ncbi:MAG: ABC transporter permease [Actinomycetota bacterium]|nr:ABC transporter permease [Actinomycetota bacterium]MDQ3573940.1 ABC transporter permease [Actinomycetota bacterium]
MSTPMGDSGMISATDAPLPVQPSPGSARAVQVTAWLPAFVRRDWKVARSYRLQFVLDLAAIPLALGLFFYLGRLVDASRVLDGELQQGYFAFGAVGFAVLGMVQTALISFTGKLRTEQTSGTFEVLMASPVSPSVVVLGSASFDVIKATVIATVTLLVAALFGVRFHLGMGSVAGLLVGVPALIMAFAALGVLVAACATVFKQVTALLGLITSALGLLSGVFFPISYLPQPLRAIAEALPFTWGVDVLRTALLKGELARSRLGLLAGFAVVSLPLSLFLFRLAVDHARRRGTLTHF